MRGGRTRWVKAVSGLVWAIEMDEKLGPVAERVHAALDEAIAAKLRARDSGDDVVANADEDAQEDASVDEDPGHDEDESDDEGDDVDEDELDQVAQ